MINSGATAITTGGSDNPVTLFTVPANYSAPSAAGFPQNAFTLTLLNEGSTAGFWSVDGTNWQRLPAGPAQVTSAVPFGTSGAATAVQVKRVPGGSDLTGIWGWAQ